MSTTLGNAAQVNLASYGTGNPFYVPKGVSIVNNFSYPPQTAIYGDASQSWTLTNAGTVAGGYGQDYGTIGGVGILLMGNTNVLTNTGSITGGMGGFDSFITYFSGGLGVSVSGNLALTNSGVIAGGAGGGGDEANRYYGADGADAVSIAGHGTVTNTDGGTIVGGAGSDGDEFGGNGAIGISIGGSGTVVNQAGAVIAGGAGGACFDDAGYGGAGIVLMAGGSVENAGTITGGAPGSGDVKQRTSASGVGVLFEGSSNSTLNNDGLVAGTDGGDGIVMTEGGMVANADTITGGAGEDVPPHYYKGFGIIAGDGGAGIALEAVGTVANTGVIIGGTGGHGSHYTDGGTGAAGIVMEAGGTVTNTGTIKGGAGGYDYFGATTGGAGISILGSANSTIINSSTISGGGGSYKGSAIRMKAVQFGAGNDRLVLHGGSVLFGGADGGNGSNVLELKGGALPGTIAGLGSLLTNFQKIVVDSGGVCTAAGHTVLAAGSNLVVKGNLTLTGTTGFAGDISGAGTLGLDGTTTITAGATCRVADLVLSNSAVLNVDENLAYSGKLTEKAGTKVSVEAAKMLAVTGTIGGSGAIDIGAGSGLRIEGVVAAAETIAFGAKTGRLTLLSPKRFRAAISSFVAGDQVDIANTNFAFGKRETLTFVENAKKTEGTLTLTNGANVVALHLFGQHVAQGFHIGSDGHGGTMITYKPPAAHALDHLASGGGG